MSHFSDEDGDNHHDISSNSYSTSPFKSWGTRHTLTILGFLGMASSYSMRVNLSIAIVDMVNSTNHHNHEHNSSNVACPELLEPISEPTLPPFFTAHNSHSLTSANTNTYPKFNWSGQDQGIVLGSFFYGYVVTQIPGGLLANKFGGKWVFGLGMLTTAIFSLVAPLAATLGLPYLIAVRIIQGLGEGVTFPSMHFLLSQWVPPLERSMLGAFVYAGTQIGTVIALPISGWLISNTSPLSSPLTSGWPSVFYIFGLLGIVWFIFWALLIHDSPSTHPRISFEELRYIQSGHKSSSSKKRQNSRPSSSTTISTPWRKLLTSLPVFAVLVAHTGHAWGLYTMLTELPTYMDDVLHFNIKQNSYLSALPYFLMWLVSVISSIYADNMRASGWKTSTVRKIFNTIAHWIPAFLLFLAANSDCNRTLAVALITLAISINGAAWASFQVNHIDLSPNHAAVMMGITNGVANLCGIGAPYVAGVIINEGSSVSRWRLIFYIASIVYFIDNVVYLLFAEGETQSWDSLTGDGEESDDDHINERIIGSDNGSSRRRVLSTATTSPYTINDDEHENNGDESPLLVS